MDQPQIVHQYLHLASPIEMKAVLDPVGDFVLQESLLDRAALKIAPVEEHYLTEGILRE